MDKVNKMQVLLLLGHFLSITGGSLMILTFTSISDTIIARFGLGISSFTGTNIMICIAIVVFYSGLWTVAYCKTWLEALKA